MKSLFRNIFSLTALQAINFLLTISILPYLIRTLGATTWGKICAVQIVINYFIWFDPFAKKSPESLHSFSEFEAVLFRSL